MRMPWPAASMQTAAAGRTAAAGPASSETDGDGFGTSAPRRARSVRRAALRRAERVAGGALRGLGLATLIVWCGAGSAAAQGATVPFGGLEHDNTLPVEITSDALALDQGAGTAVFTGAVKVGQGTLRLAADRLEVFYAEDDADAAGTGAIERMLASGNVTLSNGAEAAEATRASYVVATGIVEMDGDVLLTQGANALASETLRIDLVAGTGLLEGRVQTIFTPERTEGATE